MGDPNKKIENMSEVELLAQAVRHLEQSCSLLLHRLGCVEKLMRVQADRFNSFADATSRRIDQIQAKFN